VYDTQPLHKEEEEDFTEEEYIAFQLYKEREDNEEICEDSE